MTKWVDEIDNIKSRLEEGDTLEEIGRYYNVSKQRMYQITTKYGIQTLARGRKSFLKGLPPKYYWLNKMMCQKKVDKKDRITALEEIFLPDHCPMLGLELNYDGTGREGYTRDDCSPSIDRIDSSIGYEIGNIQVISWRANRIKNDSTPEELLKIANYMLNLTNK